MSRIEMTPLLRRALAATIALPDGGVPRHLLRRDRREDWDVADPAAQSLAVVRRIRYDISHPVAELVDSLLTAQAR